MKVVDRLRQRLDDSPDGQFECGLCTARYDRQRSNCPACGSTEIRRP